MTKQRQFIVLIVVIAILFGVYLLFPDKQGSNEQNASNESIVTFDDIDMKESLQGKTVWYLKAAHVKIDKDKDTAYLEGVEGYFKNDSGE